jgi:hypothetical protein
MVIILVTIGGYFNIGYWWILWLLMIILLVVIVAYFIDGY